MSLNQMHENLNDVFEYYFPKMNPFKGRFLRLYNQTLRAALRFRPKLFKGRILTSERVIEYPFIFQNIRSKGVILDIGCVTSRLPIQLASLGYEVHGLDVRDYSYSHPNFYFHKADIFQWKPEKKFDVIILLSTLEHFGLGGYGDLKEPEADKRAIEKISEWLKDGGQLLVTLPFGQSGVTKKHRVYDMERLKYLFSDFKWKEQKYFAREHDAWVPSSVEKLANVASPGLPPNGVALLDLSK